MMPTGGAAAAEVTKQQGVVKPELITLKVLDRQDRRVFHTMRVTDVIQDLMDKYYNEAPEITYGTGTFLFDGSLRVLGWKTPADMKLEDGDEIQFFEPLMGGGHE